MAETSLAEFLAARLDEDERVARDCGEREGGAVWTRECGHREPDDNYELAQPGHDDCPVVGGDIHIYDEGGHDASDADHIARHDPARVLAEVQAKRQIVDAFEDAEQLADIATRNGFSEEADSDVVERLTLERVCCLLALAYADHPDYEQRWRLS